MINAYGFEIILEVKKDPAKDEWIPVDKVGNLADERDAADIGRGEDANQLRRFDAPRWMWPSGFDTEDPTVAMNLRSRISLARIRNKVIGTAGTLDIGDGTELDSWILSDADSRTFRIEPVYYGHSSDISTPGQNVGQPLQLNFPPSVLPWKMEKSLFADN